MALFNLDNRIKQFKRLISKLKTRYEVETACKNEIEYLKKQGLSISTIRGYLTKYRKEVIGNKKSRKYTTWVYGSSKGKYRGLRISQDEQKEIQSDYAYKIAQQTGETQDNSLLEFSKNILSNNTTKEQKPNIKHTINDLTGLIEKAKKLLSSQSYVSVTLGLMALTGRRNTEILKTASFERVNDLVVVFDGQLKTKGSESNRPYQIFTLCESGLIIKALEKLRFTTNEKGFDELSAKQINSKTSKSISEKVKREFGQYFGNDSIKAYDLRAIYAQTIYQMIHENQGISNTASYAKSLGHVFEHTDKTGKTRATIQTTSKSYDKFLIKDSDIEALKNNLL